jgi:hypothetical protein
LHADGDHRHEVLTEAIEAAKAIPKKGLRVGAMAALAPMLRKSEHEELLLWTRELRSIGTRARLLAALAPSLEPAQLLQAFSIARAIDDDGPRSHALAALARFIPQDKISSYLETTRGMIDQGARSRTLVALAPRLDSQLLSVALEIAENISEAEPRCRALLALVAGLECERQQAVVASEWKNVATIEDVAMRARSLAALAPHLCSDRIESVVGDILRLSGALDGHNARSPVLANIAALLSPEQFAQALRATITIENEGMRSRAIEAIARHLLPSQLPEAFAAGLSINDAAAKVRVIVALVQSLEVSEREQHVAQALLVANSIENGADRAIALAALVPHLVGGERLWAQKEVLKLAREQGDAVHRSRVLIAALQGQWDDTRNELASFAVENSAQMPRHRAFVILANSVPLIAELGGAAAIVNLFDAISDVTSWYP